jgi:hypothetical protein
MRKVIPLIAGALLAGTVGLLKEGRQAEKPRSRASKRKRAMATAQGRGPAKAKRAKSRRR